MRSHGSAWPAALAFAAALGAVAAAQAQPPSDATSTPRELATIGRLVVTSGLGGHFADPACRDNDTLEPAPIARTFEWLRKDAESEGPAVLYDTGSLLAPHGIARFAAGHAPDALAKLIADLGYEALGFGEAELGSPRDAVIGAIGALRAEGIPTIATNLYCDPKGKALCDALVDAADGISIHVIGGERVAFIAMIDPGALARIAPERAEGVRLSPVEPTLAAAVREARKLGATVVIASVDDGTEDAAAHQLALAGKLPEDAKPDLLLSAGAGDQYLFARPLGFRPALAAAPPGGAARMRLRHNLLADTLDVLVRPVPAADEPHPAFARFIERVGGRYCKKWGRQLAGGHLHEPIDGQGLLELTAGAARLGAGAELAMVPRAILEPSWKPASKKGLTASDVYVGLRYDGPLLAADVRGKWLTKVAKDDVHERLVSPGLTVDDDGNVKLNGRPVEPRAEYRVVTVRPAIVGPHALPDGPDWKPIAETTLRSALLGFLSEPRSVDPRKALPDPALRPEWLFRADVRGSFAGTSVNNPCDPNDATAGCSYGESQLARASAATYGLNATLQANATAKSWGWDNTLESRYHITTAVGAASTEGDDQTDLRSTLRYRGWYERHEEPYVPQPFIETYVETEITKPKDSAYRHFLVRPTAGLQFTLTDELVLKVLGGFETEALSPSHDILPGAGGQLLLKPWTIMNGDERKVTLEGSADYFVSDVGHVNKQTLRGNLKARYQLASVLAFGWDLELFVVTEKGAPAGVSVVNSAFVQLGWVGRAIRP